MLHGSDTNLTKDFVVITWNFKVGVRSAELFNCNLMLRSSSDESWGEG